MFSAKSKIDKNDDPVPHVDQVITDFPLSSIISSPWQIKKEIDLLKQSKYSPCGIPAYFLSCIKNTVAKGLSTLLNNIFFEGTFPDLW